MKLNTPLGENRDVINGFTAALPQPASAVTLYELPIGVAVYRQRITAIKLALAAAVTGANTNNFTLTVNRYTSAGVLVGAVASVTFSLAVNGVAFGVKDMGTIAFASLNAGDVLTLSKTTTGTPTIVCPALNVTVDTRPPKWNE